MLFMLLLVCAVDENIIQEDDDELVEVSVEDCLHERRKGGRCICQAEGKDGKLIVAISCVKRCFVCVFRMDTDLVIPTPQVELGEDFRPCDPVEQLIHPGQACHISL